MLAVAALLLVAGSGSLLVTLPDTLYVPLVLAVAVMLGCQVAPGARLGSVQLMVWPVAAQVPPAGLLLG